MDLVCKRVRQHTVSVGGAGRDTALVVDLIRRALNYQTAMRLVGRDRSSFMANPIDVSKVGLLQGTSLAPICFNIAMEPLDRKLPNNSIRYADDILIFARTPEELAVHANTVHQYAGDTLGIKVGRTSRVINIYKDQNGIEYLGLRTRLGDKGNLITQVAPNAVQRLVDFTYFRVMHGE